MQCERCRQDNPAPARFCMKCGAGLGLSCARCRTELPAGAAFCSACGHSVAAPSGEPRFGSPETYTPKHLVEKILTSRGAVEGERKQVSVLVADLKGSLELLAERDPEEARKLVDPVVERMIEAVHRYEGAVHQVMGDGLMAIFGAPLAHEDHAVRACYAALRMQESVARAGDEIQRSHGIPLQVRVGLNSGDVVIRSIGQDLRMDYTAVGQTTYLAGRLQQMARPGSALMSARTLQLAESYVQVRPLGPVSFKGLETAVEVHELAGARPVRSRLQAVAARGPSPFVGREAELDQLRRALKRAQSGRGRVVTIMGEPGVGKTRLLFEFTRTGRAQSSLVLESHAVSYGKSTPYLPIIDLVKHYFQVEDREGAQSIRERVTAKLLTSDERLRAGVPALLALLEALPEDDPFRSLEPPQRRARTLDALKRLFLQESRRQPLVLVIESLQWIDTETQAVLDALVESLPTAQILLLVTHRPEYQHGWGTKTYYTQIRLDPLPPESAEWLLHALLGPPPELGPLKRMLIERTEGNPFFLEESVRTLVEAGALAGERGDYRLVRAVPSIQVPATVQAVLAARIDALPPDEKGLLQAASVIGREVPFSLLQAIAERPEEELRRALSHLQSAEFLYETNLFPDLEYSFKHALTHEVAYGSLLQERRRALDARTVEVIEQLYAGRLADQVERLAHHAFRGERWDKAIVYLREAGARAAGRSAHGEALAYFEQALAALKRLPETKETIEQTIDLCFELRPLLLQLGRLEDVLTRSREAEQLARQLGDEARLARVYTYLINYHYLKGEPDQAIEYGQRCLTIGEARDDLALQALARRYMGHCYHAQGRYDLAESVLRRNIDTLEGSETGELPAQASTSYVASCGWLAFTLADLGEFNLAQTYLEKAQRVAEASRLAYGEAIAWTLAGLVSLRRGDVQRAVPPLERSLAACRERQLAVWQPIPSSVLGLAFARLGRADAALPLLEDGVKLSEQLGIRAYLALWTTHLGEGLYLAGDTERARATARQALELTRAHKERGHEAWAHWLLGEIAAHRDPPDVEQAAGEYGQAISLAHEPGTHPLLARSHLALGQLYRRTGDGAGAAEHVSTATVLFCEMDMRAWVQEAWAELKRLGDMVIVTRYHRPLYEYLIQMFGEDRAVQLILDRRRGERRQLVQPHFPERRVAARRRQPSMDEALASRGLVVLRSAS
jgi:class 3 adenylate cyclase/tetratricopeptide (TPR) repeat protein